MLSRVPDHPALVLLSQNPEGSQMAEENLTQAMRSRADNNQIVNSSCSTSTITASALNEGAAQSNEGSTSQHINPSPNKAAFKNSKRKTLGSDQPTSYEVEEICGHRQDDQVRN